MGYIGLPTFAQTGMLVRRSVGVHRTTNLCSDGDVGQDRSVGVHVHRTTNLSSDGDVGQDGSVGVT